MKGRGRGGFPSESFTAARPCRSCKNRLACREGDISDATPELLEEQLASVEGFGEIEKPFVTTIATDRDWRKQLLALQP